MEFKKRRNNNKKKLRQRRNDVKQKNEKGEKRK